MRGWLACRRAAQTRTVRASRRLWPTWGAGNNRAVSTVTASSFLNAGTRAGGQHGRNGLSVQPGRWPVSPRWYRPACHASQARSSCRVDEAGNPLRAQKAGTPGPARPAAGGAAPAGRATPRRWSGHRPAGPGRARPGSPRRVGGNPAAGPHRPPRSRCPVRYAAAPASWR